MRGKVAGLLALSLLACDGSAARRGPVTIRVELDRARPDFGVVRVDGVRSEGAALVHALPAGSVPAADSGGALPAMAGRWRSTETGLAFTPRFPPTEGVTLVVRVDTAPGAAPLLERFEVPRSAREGDGPRVVAIYPSADTLPENLLRFYLEFASPMWPGEALEHLRLLDGKGEPVRAAFLDLSQELWDPSGTRLTVLFDPGRVKRGIRTNLEMGRPLRAGERFTLRIEPGWRDRGGRALAEPVERSFFVAPASYATPDPAAWALTRPVVGSVDPLEARFPAPLDQALARRLIAVLDPDGQAVQGAIELDDGERTWRFTPAVGWGGGRHRLAVSPELEDVAGNRPGRPFDTDLTAASGPARPTLVRWFTLKPGEPSSPGR
ncbi:MAG: hypothetical protein AB7R55_02160 [Gemmatimonadales bacterium]